MCLWLKNLQSKLQTGANIPIKYDNGLIYHMKETEKYVIKEGIRKAEKYKWPLNVWKFSSYICNLKVQHNTAAAAAESPQPCPTLRPHGRQPTRLPRPWDSPGKNPGVGCHCLLWWAFLTNAKHVEDDWVGRGVAQRGNVCEIQNFRQKPGTVRI